MPIERVSGGYGGEYARSVARNADGTYWIHATAYEDNVANETVRMERISLEAVFLLREYLAGISNREVAATEDELQRVLDNTAFRAITDLPDTRREVSGRICKLCGIPLDMLNSTGRG